jgi:monoamine oxidase
LRNKSGSGKLPVHQARTESMSISRRSFLAATAAAAATPSLGAAPAPGGVDVAIIGAGAAGIAAARRVAAAKRSFALIEANSTIGGRCITNTSIFGVPYDVGAHWIHMPDLNPVAKVAKQTGIETYPAPRGQRIRIGRRYAREGETEEFLSAFVRSERAIGEAARRGDVACSQALPRDLGDWRSTLDFVLGPYSCGKDLNEVSAVDFSKSEERDIDAFCKYGFGALLAKLAEGIPVQLGTAVRRIEWNYRTGVEIQTTKGTIQARQVVVTPSTNVLASGKIRFDPELPRRVLDALSKLSLGSYEHIALELPGNPFGLQPDDLIYEKSNSTKTAGILANVSGTALCMVDVGGKFGRDLASRGEAAMVDFALDWLEGLYGGGFRDGVKRASATRWYDEPWVMGSFSCASVGGQPSRRVLMEPLGNRMWFAGEAVHETFWGTVGGAWESGERAATEALRRIGAISEPPPEAQRMRPQRRVR